MRLGERVGRRNFIGSGKAGTYLLAANAASYAESATFTTFGVIIKAGEGLQALRRVLRIKEEHIDPLLNPPVIHHSSEHATTQLDASAWKQTHIIVFGDSIAQGHLENKPYQFNVAHYMTKLSKQQPSIQWEWTNHAWNGATSRDAALKIAATDMNKYSDGTDMKGIPVSVIHSAGGNDVLQKTVEQSWDSAQKVLANPTDAEAIKEVVQTILQAIEEYKVNLTRVIRELQTQKDNQEVNIQRLFILGVPNMSYAQTITLKDKTPLEIKGALKLFAEKISRHLNNATLTAIRESGVVDFDIMYINLFSLLKPEHMVGMHPTEEGQKLLTYEVLRRSLIDGKTLDSDSDSIYSLLEVMFGTEDITAIQQDPRTLVVGIYPQTR